MKGCKAFSPTELKRVLSNVHSLRNRTLIVLGVTTGFRITELLSLKWSDLIAEGTVKDILYVAKRNRKGKREGHAVPLNKDAKSHIAKLHASRDKRSAFVFVSREGGALSYRQAQTIIKTAASRARVSGKIGTHSMRKTFAARVYESSNKDLVTTQACLGHKNINSTNQYVPKDEKEITRVVMSISI